MQTEIVDPNQVLEFVRRRVAEGFEPEAEILAAARDVFGADEAAAREALAQAQAEHRVAMRGWLGPTDCDRLDQAFALLSERGLVARQHFACCQSCGHREIQAEREQAGARGYCFFHAQDTEAALESGLLYLAYGAAEPGEATAAGVAQEVVWALAEAGLDARWDGSVGSRIRVRVDWRKRRALDA